MAPINKIILAYALEMIAFGSVYALANTATQLIVIGCPLVIAIHVAVHGFIPTKMPD